VNDAEALQFARKHVDAWNSHDLDAIVGLYGESVELVSPMAASLAGDASVRGHKALREYFAKGLKKFPDLRFELLSTFLCESSVTLLYYGAGGKLVAEVMFLASDHKIERVFAHYICLPILGGR
jgi:hypothetical protein